jgi:hypothetical protein
LVFDVFRGGDVVVELDNGYVLAFGADPSWRVKLADFRAIMATTHPALAVSQENGAGDRELRLRIEGPRGAKKFVGDEIRNCKESTLPFGKALAPRLRRVTGWLRALPDFLIIGGARCGTTSLYAYLGKHPGVRESSRKEVGYFDRRYHLGKMWYRSHFPLAITGRPSGTRARWVQTGEATPEYLFDPRAPARAHDVVPGARLIVLLRNPLSRAYSHYMLKMQSGHEFLPFPDAVACEEERLAGELDRMARDESYFSESRMHFSYLARGVYIDQLMRWLEFFPREQMLILTAEDFNRDRPGTFRQVLEFLELPPCDVPSFATHNSVPHWPMDPATREVLRAHFAPHNARLYEFLGRDLRWDRD